MRLFRGLSKAYRPDMVPVGSSPIAGEVWSLPNGTDFTDCPLAALDYARGARGVVLVLDVPKPFLRKITEESWPNTRARRLMLWGRFDEFIAAEIPAKELRAQIRRKGIASQSDEYKSGLLADYIDQRVRDGSLESLG